MSFSLFQCLAENNKLKDAQAGKEMPRCHGADNNKYSDRMSDIEGSGGRGSYLKLSG